MFALLFFYGFGSVCFTSPAALCAQAKVVFGKGLGLTFALEFNIRQTNSNIVLRKLYLTWEKKIFWMAKWNFKSLLDLCHS